MPKQPAQGGVRRRRTKMPMLSGTGDTSIVRYSTLGRNLATGGSGTGSGTGFARYYVPGYSTNDLLNGSGPAIVSFYSTAKFMPGTTIRWEPSVSFTTSGRVLVGFTDNPEIITNIQSALNTYFTTPNSSNLNVYLGLIRGLGSLRTFPVWQETDITFPTKLRRKRFDVNSNLGTLTSDVADRCAQTVMFTGVEGAPDSTILGSFWFHDVVDVEGVTGVAT